MSTSVVHASESIDGQKLMHRATIEGMQFTLLRDEDAPNLRKLQTPDGKLKWLEKRVDFALIKPCQKAMREAQDNDLGLVLMTGICAGISAASTFLHGRQPNKQGENKKFFVNFLTHYMDPDLCGQCGTGTTWHNWLYSHLRCSLSHAFVIDRGGFDFDLPAYVNSHCEEPKIDARRFLDDFKAGWKKYLNEIRGPNATDLRDKFTRRWDELFRPEVS